VTSSPNVAVVVGNPKPASRTLHAAVRVAEQLSGTRPATVIDLATLGPALLDPADPAVNSLVESVRRSSLVVVASPTYKATYTGLLKLFLDRFPTDSLAGVVAIPVMLGAGLRHALAPEVFLRPVLAELGATLPTRALYLLEQDYDQPSEYEPWLTETRRQLTGAADVFAGSLR
jgi:FMN reductase